MRPATNPLVKLTEAAAQRIIDATDLKGSPTPPAADLIRHIENALPTYELARKLVAGNRKKIAGIRNAAKNLENLLRETGFEPVLFAVVQRGVKNMDDFLYPEKDGPDQAYYASLSDRGPFERLVGEDLAHSYEKSFRRTASYLVSGPYTRFVQATLAELGITNGGAPPSPHTIAQARKKQALIKKRLRTSFAPRPKTCG